MSLVLDLPPELETKLAAEAAQAGLSLSEYVSKLLAGRRNAKLTPGTGTELVAYWESEGLIGTRTEIVDSQAHARGLRQQAERRTRL